MTSLKNKTKLISYRCRVKISENQIQSLILQIPELQHKLNLLPCRASFVEVEASTGKKQDPENWNGSIGANSDEAVTSGP